MMTDYELAALNHEQKDALIKRLFEQVERLEQRVQDRIRLHSSDGHCSPVDYRKNNVLAAKSTQTGVHKIG
jgi:hypothetical protein